MGVSTDKPLKEAFVAKIETLVFSIVICLSFMGCVGVEHQFYDSALNNKNRAPASFAIPESFDNGVITIDAMHNQTEADFLFLKSEMESSSNQNQQGDDSIELLKSALVYDPGAVTIMQKLAVEYYRNAKMSDAVYWAEKARALEPDRRDLNLLTAGLYTTTKNYVKAEALYKRLSKNDPEDTEVLLYLGAIYTEQKNYSKAIATFKALSNEPGYASRYLAHYYLARVYFEQNKLNINKTKGELKKSILLKPDFYEAINMLGHLIEKTEGRTQAYTFYAHHQNAFGPNLKLAELLSQYYITTNQFDKAYEQLEILDQSSEDMIQVKLKMSLILIEKKLYDPAIVKLQEILKLAPESDKVRFYLAAVFEEKKEYQNAFDQYVKIEKSSEYFEESRLHAAFLAKLMGRVDQAMLVLKESIDKKAENPQTYFLMSQLFEDQKNYKHALDTLKKAEEKFPKNSKVYYYQGALLDKMKLKEDMILSMKKVLVLEPSHTQALNYLAYTWAEMGHELELAENYARKAVENEKNDAFILDTLGWVLFKKGKLKEAAEILDKAHAMQPQASIILEHLGDVYAKMNRYEKARNLFIKAAEVEEDQERKKEITSKLTSVEGGVNSLRKPASLGVGLKSSESP